ncbi:DUF3821 domain-containing protein [Methanoregula sp.]|jgi:hypothetical protein|uniref:DUF3821 domain-containing protein n=1 Tax=Methanoregula sp. TaxID=2052170 RepID=UPI0025D6D846|nr:DUF3821 domain-containing protein [Methanoregula sp.]
MIPSRIPLVFLLLLCLILVPATASLTKVANDAPIFIGERNLDLTACLNAHTVIAWWPAGSDRSGEPSKTLTISGDVTSFYVDPDIFTGYTGTWYSHDIKPDIPVLQVYQPQMDLSIWDVDANKDITGQSVPMSANITYHIDTNLYMALDYSKRPNYNPSDSFFTVKLMSPSGTNIPQIYTGNLGASTTQIINFDSNPLIKSSPYIWKNGPAWDRNAKSTDGSSVYPTGTYTFEVTQDLNHMSSSYNGTAAFGTITSGDKIVTFIADTFTTSPTVLPSLTAPVETVATTAGTTMPTQQVTVQPKATTVPKKTTYSPLPAEIALMGLGIAALVIAMRRKY